MKYQFSMTRLRHSRNLLLCATVATILLSTSGYCQSVSGFTEIQAEHKVSSELLSPVATWTDKPSTSMNIVDNTDVGYLTIDNPNPMADYEQIVILTGCSLASDEHFYFTHATLTVPPGTPDDPAHHLLKFEVSPVATGFTKIGPTPTGGMLLEHTTAGKAVLTGSGSVNVGFHTVGNKPVMPGTYKMNICLMASGS